MKTTIILISFAFLSFSSVYSTPVTNIAAVYRYGQVFVTWDNTIDSFFILYKSSSPILHGNQLPSAQKLGLVIHSSAYNMSAGRFLRIDSASPPLASTKGLFAATTTANGPFYYAVTTRTNNIEDTTIVPGSNSLSSPVNETLNEPRPVWQDYLGIFHVYVWFATRVTSPNFPQMTNAGSYPLNFAIVMHGTQSPHPVTFWMRPSGLSFLGSYWGTGDPNEWVISIDDYTPSYDGLTYYYGYHENYDIYSPNPNPIPTTGTIYNYTSRMVSHTVNWALRNLPLDSTRTYMTGWSLGAIGSIFNSLMMPSRIAAIFIYAPNFNMAAWSNSFLIRLYGTYQTNLFTNEGMRRNERLNVNYLASINRLNSLPIIYSFCGKNDVNVGGWAEKIPFYDSMNVLRHGGFHFWSMSNHQQVQYQNPWRIAAYPPSFPFFTRYRTNLSYPAFSNCSVNNDPGNGSPQSGDSIGTINGFLDWNDNIVDTLNRWEITLKTKNLVTVYDTLHAPDSCTVDVTPRRLQRFNPPIGATIQWVNIKSNGDTLQQGSFLYTGGLMTIDTSVKVYRLLNTLKLYYSPIGIANNQNTIPSQFALYQNYPNPFNPSTKIRFALPKSSFAKLVVYDVLGREVEVLVNEQLNAGTYEVDFPARTGGDGTNLASGIYYVVMKTGNFVDTKKMIFVK